MIQKNKYTNIFNGQKQMYKNWMYNIYTIYICGCDEKP